MITVVADDTFLLKDLALFHDVLEIRDPDGKVLGIFVPANLERCRQLKEKAAARIDRTEILRRIEKGQTGTTTLGESLDQLARLDAELMRRQSAGERDWTTDEALAYFSSLGKKSLASNGSSAEVESKSCVSP